MFSVLQDLRFALRQLRKNPGFALTTLLTLALGIGATTAMFSLINAVLLRPLSFPHPDRLVVAAAMEDQTKVPAATSYPDFFDWRQRNHSFQAMASYRPDGRTLTGAGTPQRMETQIVAADFFRVLEVEPMLGRGFVRDDEKPGTHVAVLSNQIWKSVFGGAPDIVGRNMTLDNVSYTIIGVMPPNFSFPVQNPAPAAWTTLADDAMDKEPLTAQRGALIAAVVARLKPGVSIPQATADLSVITHNLAAQYPDSNKKFANAIVVPELEDVVGNTRQALNVLFAAVMFLLLIACANVAGLMLSRASRRQSEIAVRAAMGASRLEIMRQVLVESIVLSLCGGMLGVALSAILLKTILQFVPENLPRLDHVSVDGHVLVFAALVSVLTGMLFGVLPAWRMSRLDPALSLRESSRTMTSGRGQHRLHNVLVVAETAIGLVLLIGAGLLIRSFIRVLNVDPGFDPHHVLSVAINLPDQQYPLLKNPEFYDKLLPKLKSLPGVDSVAAGWPIPVSRHNITIGFTIEGQPVAAGDQPVEPMSVVTPGFFHTLRIPLVQGRDFLANDDSKSQPVMIVNQAFVRKYFHGENAIGKRIKVGLGDGILNDPVREIVGVVGDVKRHGLTAQMPPQYYLPLKQAIIVSPSVLVRTSGDPVNLLAPVRAAVAQIDPDIPVYQVRTLDDYVSVAAAQPRFQTVLIGFFALMAMLLAAIGLYAVLSYMVAQRTLEIGLRLALGAQRDRVLGLILRRGLTLALTGLAIGLVASMLLTRFLQDMLFGVQRFDPMTFAGVSLVLLLVSLIASSVPAMRAARLDPMRTLREQ